MPSYRHQSFMRFAEAVAMRMLAGKPVGEYLLFEWSTPDMACVWFS